MLTASRVRNSCLLQDTSISVGTQMLEDTAKSGAAGDPVREKVASRPSCSSHFEGPYKGLRIKSVFLLQKHYSKLKIEFSQDVDQEFSVGFQARQSKRTQLRFHEDFFNYPDVIFIVPRSPDAHFCRYLRNISHSDSNRRLNQNVRAWVRVPTRPKFSSFIN